MVSIEKDKDVWGALWLKKQAEQGENGAGPQRILTGSVIRGEQTPEGWRHTIPAVIRPKRRQESTASKNTLGIFVKHRYYTLKWLYINSCFQRMLAISYHFQSIFSMNYKIFYIDPIQTLIVCVSIITQGREKNNPLLGAVSWVLVAGLGPSHSMELRSLFYFKSLR